MFLANKGIQRRQISGNPLRERDEPMIKHIVTLFGVYILIRLGVGLLDGPIIPVDNLVGRIYWPPLMSLQFLPDMVFSITRVLPVFPILIFVSIFFAGLLALAEID